MLKVETLCIVYNYSNALGRTRSSKFSGKSGVFVTVIWEPLSVYDDSSWYVLFFQPIGGTGN